MSRPQTFALLFWATFCAFLLSMFWIATAHALTPACYTQVPTRTPTLSPTVTSTPTAPVGNTFTFTPTNTPPTPPGGGAVVWVHQYGGTGGDVGRAVTTDPSGNILLLANFQTTANFGGGPITSAGTDIIVAKYTTGGVYQWATHAGNNAGQNYPYGIAADASGNIYATGQYFGILAFGGACGAITSLGYPSGNASSIFLVKLNGATGACLWVKSFGSGINSAGHGVAVDASGNVILAGNFWGPIKFDGINYVWTQGDDAFAAKYDTNGTFIWEKNFPNLGSDYGSGVAVDTSGNIVMTGTFNGSMDFGSGMVSSGSGQGVFIVKLAAANAATQWSRVISQGVGNAVAIDASNNIVVTGYILIAADFGAGAVPITGAFNTYTAKYNGANGAYIWANVPTVTNTLLDMGNSIAVDAGGNVVITGFYQGTINFGNGVIATTTAVYGIYTTKFLANGTPQWIDSWGSSIYNIGYGVWVSGTNPIATGAFQALANFGGTPLTSLGSSDSYLVKLAP